jgi:hypothetical protein
MINVLLRVVVKFGPGCEMSGVRLQRSRACSLLWCLLVCHSVSVGGTDVLV